MRSTSLPRRDGVASSLDTVPAPTRVRGFVAMLMGSALIVGCGSMLWWWLQRIVGAAEPGDVRWTGTVEQGFAAAALLGTATALGPVFVVGGWQLFRQGRFSRRVGQLAIALISVFLTLLFYAKGLFR